MKILEKWRRPKWQHPDAVVRLKALAEESIDPADCHALAVTDPDPAVRERALERLESVEQLLDVLRAQPAAQAAVAVRLTTLLLQASAATVGQHLAPGLAASDAAGGPARLASGADDPEIRIAAVGMLQDAAVLRCCALEDKAVEVRVCAVQRIEDEDTLLEIGRAVRGRDKTVARLAAQRLADLQSRRERSAERAQLLDELSGLADSVDLDADTLQRARARWNDLDSDADTAQRERYAVLAPRLDARLAALRKAQQEDLSHKLEREKLLEQLRRLAADLHGANPEQVRAALQIMRAGWEQATALQDGWTERRLQEDWREISGQIESGLRKREQVVRQERAIAAAIGEVEAVLEQGGLTAKQVEAARQRWSELSRSHGENPAFEKPLQRFANLVERMAVELARAQDEVRTVRRRLKEAVEKLETALEQKQLDPATAAHRTVTRLLGQAGDDPQLKSLQRRVAKCEPGLRELQSWRNWGSDKAREELVEEARRLAEADISVEARAETLNSLRARWKALGGGGPKARRLWESFDAACTAAYQPIKLDRKQQAQQRQENLETRAGICDRLERLAADTDWSSPDWRAVDRALAESKRQWRATGGVPHKQWDTIRERFDRAVDGVEQHVAKERRHNFLQRKALVKDAEALADSEDTRHAVAEARRLREAWQVTARSSHKEEQALWKAFNAALDGVFNRERAARNEFKAGLEEQRQQAEALCTELEDLSRNETAQTSKLRAELSRLSAAFGQLGTLPRQAQQGLQARFRQAGEKLRRRIADAELADARQALVDYQVLHTICEQAEAAAQGIAAGNPGIETLAANWEAAAKPAVHKDLLAALERRFAAARSAIDAAAQPDQQTLARNAAQRGEICLDLEILRKQESPPDVQNERMQRQVALLEAAMKGIDEPPERKIRRLQLDYLGQGPVPCDQQQVLAERFARLFP